MKALLFLVVLCICFGSQQGNELKSLEMANDEGINYFCYGKGDIECYGMKIVIIEKNP